MARTFTETVGLVQQLIAYMDDADNVAALTAKNFDVAPHKTRLQTKRNNITQLNTDQEQLKVSLLNKTAELNTASDDGYTDASGLIDAMAGLLGKTTAAGRNLLDLRANIRRGPQPPPPTPPGP